MKDAWDYTKGSFGVTIDCGFVSWFELGLSFSVCLDPRHPYIDVTVIALHTWFRICWIKDYPQKGEKVGT